MAERPVFIPREAGNLGPYPGAAIVGPLLVAQGYGPKSKEEERR